jgi:hypothetical protein
MTGYSMDNKQVREVADEYIAQLNTHTDSIPPERANTGDRFMPEGERKQHLVWMLEEIINMPDDKFEKANRWLGFVQGAMWSLGLRSVDEMRNDNR